MRTADILSKYTAAHGTKEADELYDAVNTLAGMGLVSKQQADSIRDTRIYMAQKKIEEESKKYAGMIVKAANEYAEGGTVSALMWDCKTAVMFFEQCRASEFDKIGF